MTLAEDLLAELNQHCETAEQLDTLARLVMKYSDEANFTAEEYAAIVEAGKYRRYVVTTPQPW